MEVFEAIQNRRSIRKYKKQDVPEDAVDKLIEAARLTPTAGNAQSYQLVIVRQEEQKQRLSKAAGGQKQVANASVVIVVCADQKRAKEAYGDRGKDLYCLQDTAAVTMNIMLTATSLGLGTCWVGAFNDGDLKKVVNAPKDVLPVAMIPVGYPDESPAARPRRSVSEFVHKEAF